MFVLNIILTLVWLTITADITIGNTVLGFFIALFVISLGEHSFPRDIFHLTPHHRPHSYPVHLWKIIAFGGFFLRELMKASIDVVLTVLNPARLRPGVIAVPLDLTRNIQITLLGNLITLTPGTLTLEVSEDKKTIFVHSIHVEDPVTFRQQIKEGFEKRILEILP